MSYDLHLVVETASNQFLTVLEFSHGSITYNLAEMLTALKIKEKDSDILIDVNRWQINHAIEELKGPNSFSYKQYESENGWGTILTLLEALTSIKRELDYYMQDKEDISDDLYIAWY
jgi:hypothetical protein